MSETNEDLVAKGILLVSAIVGVGGGLLAFGLSRNEYIAWGVGILTAFLVSILLVEL